MALCFLEVYMRIGFVYNIVCFDHLGNLRWRRTQHNIIPNEGRTYMLRAAFEGGIQHYPWFIGVYEAPYTPTYDETLSSLLSACLEIDTYNTVNNNRVILDAQISGNGVWSNYFSAADIVFTDTKLVQGIFITSSRIRNDTNGLLLSVVRLDSPETVAIGETLSVATGIVLLT